MKIGIGGRCRWDIGIGGDSDSDTQEAPHFGFGFGPRCWCCWWSMKEGLKFKCNSVELYSIRVHVGAYVYRVSGQAVEAIGARAGSPGGGARAPPPVGSQGREGE